ncbi:tetratricopeptide repeat protein [Aquisalimonas lutea]|uniref:tetratricopeptide repeat protein n=1 Tax=Aquisalimonas lutea TaxID=1327750 RepID=UPI0025B2BD74|nr:tetratricopeptide repeat protein [Aquisalimonas lutea]MDN3519571.1 tetratricopeptide repeat protein [Aquisalimonas lutea]
MKPLIKNATLVTTLMLVGLQVGVAQDDSPNVPLPGFDSVEEQLEEAMRTFHESDPDNWAFELKAGSKGEEALNLFRPLAENGCAQAQYMLSRMLYGRDVDRAASWARRAGEQGHAVGQATMGTYSERMGEYAQALHWYRRAAEAGHVTAMFRVADYYKLGRVVEKDYVQAYKWYSLTIPRVPPDSNPSGFDRSHYQDQLAELEEQMTDGEVARAERLVEEWEAEHDEVHHFPDNPEPPKRLWYERIEGGCDR